MDFYQKIELEDNKVLFVGDTHFNSVPPLSRIDDYSQTCIVKLRNVKKLSIEKGYKTVIFMGDIFHRTQQPFSYVYQIISTLKGFHDEGIKVFTIFGNHDLPYEKVENVVRTPLGILLQTNYMKSFGEINICVKGKSIKIKGFHYPDSIVKAKKNDLNICVAHRFYNYDLSESTLKRQDIEKLAYDYYILGHDHVPYDDVEVEDQVIIRPGALLRGTKHEYNLNRDIYLDALIFKVENDKVITLRKRHILECNKAEEVFSAQAYSPKGDKAELEDFEESVEELLSKMEDFGTEIFSVYKILDSMGLETNIKSRIEKYLEDCGIIRKLDEYCVNK